MAQEQAKSTNKCALFVRVMNFLTGFLLVGFGIAGIVLVAINSISSLKFFLICSPIFMLIFGLMILAVQCRIKFMLEYFSFLQGMIGRGCFNIYMSSSVYYYFACTVGDSVLAWIFGTLVFITGIIYFVLYCTGERGYQSQTKEQMM